MAINEDLFTQSLSDQLDALLSSTDTSKVTSEGIGFEDLPVGYYLAEVETATLTISKSSKLPMVSLKLKIVDNGLTINSDDELVSIPSTKNRFVFKHYPFKDEDSVKRYVSDMLSFLDENDEPLLPAEAWKSKVTMEASLEVLEMVKPRVWVNITLSKTPNEQGVYSTFTNIMSWKRAGMLGLPIE